MKLIVITSEITSSNDGLIINKLFKEGMETLHLRKPFDSEADVKHLLEQIDEKFYDRIVLHDYFNLLQSFDLKGIHLNRRNSCRPPIAVMSVSCSCHSFECLETSLNQYDYMFLSPVFDSISKSGYLHAFTMEQLLEARLRFLINEKVVALGGINKETIPLAAQYGFGGVAVLGAVWGSYLQDKDEDALLERFTNLQTMTYRL